jgi:hypothetical protein
VIEQVFKKRAVESGLIPPGIVLQLFGNISALVTMHRTFRAALAGLQSKYDGGAVLAPGEVIRECLAGIKKTEYAQFVSNLDMAREAYMSLSPEAAQLIAECEKWEPIAKKRWKLTDFIMQPFQRMIRYPLLLRAVLKYTPAPDTDEKAAIEDAITGSEELLGFVPSVVTSFLQDVWWSSVLCDTAHAPFGARSRPPHIRYLNKVKAEMEVRQQLQKIASSTTYSAEITGPETVWLLKMSVCSDHRHHFQVKPPSAY